MARWSYAARGWRPDVLVELKLEAGGQMIREDSFGQRLRIEDAVDRRDQHGRRPRREPVTRDDIARELIIRPILDDELDLVVRRQQPDIAPVVLVRLAAGGPLYVHNFHDRRRHSVNR